MVDDGWEAISPQQTAELLASLDVPWWIAGGWAIDLFLGRQTRAHVDLDVALLRGTEPALREALPNWDAQIAYEGQFIPWDGDPMLRPYHQFWARPDPESGWALEFMLEEHTDVDWLYRRDSRVTLPLANLGRLAEDGVPYLNPEVALLYKARGKGIERNEADFESASPELSSDARRWLHDALLQAHAGHPWIKRL